MDVAETLKGLLWEMRPWQWYKQSIVFLGIIFSGNLLNLGLFLQVVITAASFCLVAGGNYIINDISDREKDRKHPEKKNRPIASGLISLELGVFTAVVFILAGFSLAYYVNLYVLAVVMFYLLQNLLYSFKLKEVIFVDVTIISVGFVLRAIAGVLAISTFISPWLIICTLLAALLLAIGKRKAELFKSDNRTRESLEVYSSKILDQMSVMVGSSLIVSYSLYTFFGANNIMMVTLPFAYIAIFRYWHLVENGEGEKPSRLLTDRFFIIDIAIWSIFVLLSLYFGSEIIEVIMSNAV